MHSSAIFDFALISLVVSISVFKNGETTNTLQNNFKEQLMKLTVKHVSTTHTVSTNCLLKKCWAIRNPAHPIWLWVTFPGSFDFRFEGWHRLPLALIRKCLWLKVEVCKIPSLSTQTLQVWPLSCIPARFSLCLIPDQVTYLFFRGLKNNNKEHKRKNVVHPQLNILQALTKRPVQRMPE